MNAKEWDLSTDAYKMLDVLFPQKGSGSSIGQERELKLYYCGLARVHWQRLSSPMKTMIEIAEVYADDRKLLQNNILEFVKLTEPRLNYDQLDQDIVEWEQELTKLNIKVENRPVQNTQAQEFYRRQSTVLCFLPFQIFIPPNGWLEASIHRPDLIRDIYPRFPSNVKKEWRSEKVVELAKSIYSQRNFQALPILSDALQEAGCDDQQIIQHCHLPCNTHARGCWVIDQLLKPEQFFLNQLAENAFAALQLRPKQQN